MGTVVVMALSLVGLSAAAQDESDLAAARGRIAAIEDRLEAAAAASQGAELRLEEARATLAEVEAVVNAVAQRVDDQEAAVRAAEGELRRLEGEEQAARDALRDKAIDLYKRGVGSDLATLVDARDIESALDRSAFLELVGKEDTARIEDLDGSVRRTHAAREVLVREQAVLDDLLAEQEAVMAEAEQLRDSRALAAAVAADEVDRLATEHDELTDLAAEIERAIADRKAAEEAARREAAARAADEAEAESAAAASPSSSGSSSSGSSSSGSPSSGSPSSGSGGSGSSGGGYAWPLCGPVTSEFGWRWGRAHQGLDIDDTHDRSIAAAQSGTVIFAGWNSGGYGNLVLVRHGDGVVTAYAHASAVHVGAGQAVSRGQTIATVGSTGNSTGPHLHFETRVGGSEAVDPRRFLSGSGC